MIHQTVATSAGNRTSTGDRRIWSTLSCCTALLLLAACGGPVTRPEPVITAAIEPGALPEPILAVALVEEARASGPTLEVAPLENPAVEMLVTQADSSREQSDLDTAAGLLQRALRLEPDNPRLWQRLAEIRLQQGRYLEAEEMAMRSLRHSARVGEWCRRNWLTLRETRRALGDPAESERAANEAVACLRPPPPRY